MTSMVHDHFDAWSCKKGAHSSLLDLLMTMLHFSHTSLAVTFPIQTTVLTAFWLFSVSGAEVEIRWGTTQVDEKGE